MERGLDQGFGDWCSRLLYKLIQSIFIEALAVLGTGDKAVSKIKISDLLELLFPGF